MKLKGIQNIVKEIVRYVKRRLSLLLIAFMLGMSNVILEETRTINDTRAEIELQERKDDDSIL